MRRHFRTMAYRVLHYSGATRFQRFRGGAVFCYHNVLRAGSPNTHGDPSLHMPVTDFAEQVEWIARVFAVVPLDEIVNRVMAGHCVRGLAALTFDDGYAGAVDNAVPLLRRMSLPFSIFPVVHAADSGLPFWWDVHGRISRDQRLRFLTAMEGDHRKLLAQEPARTVPEELLPARWPLLRSLLGDDCTIGVHSVTHRNLSVLDDAEIAWELTHARERIEEELGVVADVFAYPYGLSSPAVARQASLAGFRAGLTLDYGLAGRDSNPQMLERINVPGGLTGIPFACWASGLRVGS